jgi:PAS domain S-box-containing protein
MGRKPTTRLLLTSWLVATAAGTLLVVSLTVLWAEAKVLDRQLADRARLLSQTLGAAVASGGTAELLASSAPSELRAGVVTDSRGDVLWRFGPSDVELQMMAPDLVWAEEVVPGSPEGHSLHPGPFTSRVAVSRAEIRRTLVDTGLRVLAVLILVLVVSVIAGLTLADAVVQPLQRLAGQLREFTVGHGAAEPVEIGPTAELQAISEAFDDMVRRLTAQQRILEEGARRYRELFEASPAPQLELDADGRIRAANAAAEPFVGLDPDEFWARPVEDFLAETSRPRFRAAADRASGGQGVALEAIWRLPGGSDTEVGLTLGQAPETTRRGGLVMVLSDLSDQVRRLGERWRRTFEAMNDGVAVIAADGSVIQANRRFQEHRAAVESGIASRVPARDEQPWRCESTGRRLACALFWPAGAGEAIAVVRDVTDAEAAERRARDADRLQAMARVAAGVAHDFNNLLAGISVQLDLAKRSPAALEDALAAVAALADEGQQVVGEMLFLSGGVGVLVPVDLAALLRDHAVLMGHLCEGVAAFETDLSEDPVWVAGNAVALRRAVTNLVVNAREAIERGPGGRLGLSLAVGSETAVIRVRDDGPGIPPEAMERLFEPFFTQYREGRGAGLGLAVVHSVVTDHRGTVTVESAPGQGAVFDIELPTIDPPESVDAVGCRVLVVDPDGRRAGLLLEALAAAGCEVSHARGADDLGRGEWPAPEVVVARIDDPQEAEAAIGDVSVPVILITEGGSAGLPSSGWFQVDADDVPDGVVHRIRAMEA